MTQRNAAGSGSTRLAAIAELVPGGTRVADIGADHGRLAAALLESNRVPHCIATDRDELALAALRTLAGRRFPAGNLEIRGGDGLGVLRAEDGVETVVLAGLGGRTIVRLLAPAGRLGITRVVLQPQTEPAGVRRWLVDNGYHLVDERLALDRGRIYEVIAGEPSPGWRMPEYSGLSEDDLYEVGPCLVVDSDPLLRTLWEARLGRLERIAHGVSPGRERKRAAERADQAARILASLCR
jgi:tRNA (adenine22-N1)-methyltransferase